MRPSCWSDRRKLVLGLRTERSPEFKQQIIAKFDQEHVKLESTQTSAKEYWSHMEAATGIGRREIRRICKPAMRQKVRQSLSEKAKKPVYGRKRYWKRNTSSAHGVRMGADGKVPRTGRRLYEPIEIAVKRFAKQEEENGVDFDGHVLVDEFYYLLVRAIDELEEKEKTAGLDGDEKTRLRTYQKKVLNLSTASGAAQLRNRLLWYCQRVDRKPGNVGPYTDEENKLITHATWQSFDSLFQALATGDAVRLAHYVGEPTKWIAGRQSIPLVATDAIPVYLDLSAGNVSVPAEYLDNKNSSRRQKKAAQKRLSQQRHRSGSVTGHIARRCRGPLEGRKGSTYA